MLMKACVGAAPVETSGTITFNGHQQDEFNPMRTARYVDQFDLHTAQLTVRETLTFSAKVQGPGYGRSAPSATSCWQRPERIARVVLHVGLRSDDPHLLTWQHPQLQTTTLQNAIAET